MIKDEEQKEKNKKKIIEMITFIEGINTKIKSDSSFDAK